MCINEWVSSLAFVMLVVVVEGSARERTMFQAKTGSLQCDNLNVPSCLGLGYNETIFPNLAGMNSQVSAEHAMTSFRPLIRFGCSTDLRLLLCGFYAPMCSSVGPVPPCQSFCNSVRLRCSPVMATFGYLWPPDLNCSRLPVSNTPATLCMEGPNHRKSLKEKDAHGLRAPTCDHPYCKCKKSLSRSQLFSPADKEFASVWMAIWSVVCFGMTLFTLVTFLL